MPDGPAYLTRDTLLAFAVERGRTVSSEQLDRWRKRGLIPSPELKGRGRGQGVEARYPLSAGAQLVAVADELQTNRDLDGVGWRLWWRGFDVDERFLREQLTEAIAGLERLRANIEKIRDDDDASRQFEQATRARLTDRTVARIRRRLGKDRFATFAMLIMQMVSGAYEGVDDNDAHVVVHGAELPSLNIDFAPMMQWIARVLDPQALRAALDATAEGGLATARAELQRLIGPLVERLSDDGHVLLGGAPGFLLSALVPEAATDFPPELVLVWLRARRQEWFRPVFEGFAMLLRRPASEWSQDISHVFSRQDQP